MKILVFGSLNIDHDYYVDHLMAPGETIAADKLVLAPGGKGLNQAIALAKSGLPVSLAGCLGPDSQLLDQTMEQYHVDADLIKRDQTPTGHAIITIDAQGANSIMIYGGANQQIDQAYIDSVLAQFGQGDIIIVQNEISSMVYLLNQAYRKKMTIVANPSPFNSRIADWPLALIDWFFINETEGAALTGRSEYPDIAAGLLSKFPTSRFVLTLGGQGSWYIDSAQIIKQPAYHVKAVDTVGAGDTFLGYFVNGLYNNLTPAQCLSQAAKAAAICVSRIGAAQAVPTMDEVSKADL